MSLFKKQRKSPENGDWKDYEALKKYFINHEETKKVSWKWRLKDVHEYPISLYLYTETKKVSWKWRLKDTVKCPDGRTYHICQKQRKSPENGDWKLIRRPLWERVLVLLRNKESLLKMEIESYFFHFYIIIHENWNKESLLKMEIESLLCLIPYHLPAYRKQRKSPENGDWKHMSSLPSMSSIVRNKESLLKMEIEREFTIHWTVWMWRQGNKESLLKMEIERWALL